MYNLTVRFAKQTCAVGLPCKLCNVYQTDNGYDESLICPNLFINSKWIGANTYDVTTILVCHFAAAIRTIDKDLFSKYYNLINHHICIWICGCDCVELDAHKNEN